MPPQRAQMDNSQGFTAHPSLVSSPPSPGTSSSSGGFSRGPSYLTSSGRSPGAPCPSRTGSLTPAIAPPLRLALPSRLWPCISSGLIGSSAAGAVLSTHFDFQPGRASGTSSSALLPAGFRLSFRSLFVIRHSLLHAYGIPRLAPSDSVPAGIRHAGLRGYQ